MGLTVNQWLDEFDSHTRSQFMEGNAVGMVPRLALKTRFREIGWSSTLLPSAKNV